MSSLRQLLAIARLVARQWLRLSPRLRGGGPPEPKRGLSALLLRSLTLVVMTMLGVQYGHLVRLMDQSRAATLSAWVFFGVSAFVFAISFAIELPVPRAPISPLKSPLLDLLPLTHAARLAINLSQTVLVAPIAVAFTWTVVPGLFAVVLGAAVYLCAALWGLCAGKLLRHVLPTYWAARAGWLTALVVMAGILSVQSAITLAVKDVPPPFGPSLASALFGSQRLVLLLKLGALLALPVLIWVRLERRGVDQDSPIKGGIVKAKLSALAGPVGVERLLNAREPGGRFFVPFAVVLTLALTSGFLVLTHRTQIPHLDAVQGVLFLLVAQMVLQWGVGRAARGAARDSLARPLLGALPLAPRDTLAAKVTVLRRDLLLIVAPLLLLLGQGVRDPAILPAIAWRVAALVTATAVLSQGMVAVAFLTLGLGHVRPRSGAFGSLESLLLVLPFLGVIFAPDPLSAATSLACLIALTLEARRAAARVVDWLDDPGAEHGTELWRALVMFAAFQAAQLLIGQLLGMFGESVSDAQRLGIVYVITGVGLYFASESQQTSPSLPFRARRGAWGVLGGLVAGAFAFGYVRALTHYGFAAPGLEMTGVIDQVLVTLAIVMIAPFAEERFFRGWLLPEIERALGKPRLAIVVSALAFAAVHPSISFLPVFVLGLVTAVLAKSTQSLTACILAHAVYNALAMLH